MPLANHFDSLPDGPVWVTGKMLKAFAAALYADRAVLAPGIGNEIPTISGRVLYVLPGGAVAPNFPFQLLDYSDTEAMKIRVVYGTVNGHRPDGMSAGDDPQYILTITGSSGVIYLELTVDDSGNITDTSIGVGSTLPDDDYDDGDFYMEIGSYSVTDEQLSIAQALTSSQSFELCGTIGIWGPA
jgi:hypothetical protein